MKKGVFLMCLLTITSILSAKDVIITKSSEKIEAHIESVSASEIRYKKASYMKGPTFIIGTAEVVSVIYGNGEVQLFNLSENDSIEENGLINDTSQVEIFQDSEKKDVFFMGLTGTYGIPIGCNNRGSTSGDFSYYTTIYGRTYYGTSTSFGVDFAWQTSDHFAIGLYTNIGFNWAISEDLYYSLVDVRLGLLMLLGDINERPFLLGIVPFSGFVYNFGEMTYFPVEIRFGRMITNSAYLTLNLSSGMPILGPRWVRPDIIFEPSITIGFPLEKKQK